MDYALFVLLGIFWSLSFLAIKITIINLAPILSAFLRVIIAQIFLTVLFVVMRKQLKVPFCSMWRSWVIGIFLQGIPFLFLFVGECYVTPALASIINGTVAIWVMLFSIVLFRDFTQVTLAKFTGLIFGILGICVIFMPMLNSHERSSSWAVVGIIIMAMSYAFGALLNQRFCQCKYKVHIQANLWHQHWGSMTFLFLMLLIFEPHVHLTPLFSLPSVWLSLLYLGICSTAIAWFIYCHLISHWGAVRASSVLYIVPLLTLIWDMLFLRLFPTWSNIVGIAIILLGVYLIQFSKKRKIPIADA